MTIKYVKGDATNPQAPGRKIIAHVCNDIGAWGKGFVLSLTLKWPYAEKQYRKWYGECLDPDDPQRTVPFALGRMQLLRVANEVWVANMIAQRGIMAKDGVPPIRYDALAACLTELRLHVREMESATWTSGPGTPVSVHMPRIGCGLAGGEWSQIEPIVAHSLKDIAVYVYDFVSNDKRCVPWHL